MASIPLPALAVQPPPSPVDQYAKVLQLKSLLMDQQQKQQNLTDQQALTKSMRDWDGQDYGALSKSVLQNGGSANAALAVQQHALTVKKTVSDIAASDAATGQKNLDNFIAKNKAIGDSLETLTDPKQVPDEQLHDTAIDHVNMLVKNNVLDPQHAQQLTQQIQATPDPQTLRTQMDMAAKSFMGQKAIADQAKTAAETAQENAKAAAENAQAALTNLKLKGANMTPADVHQAVASVIPDKWGDPTLGPRTESRMNFALAHGDLEGVQSALKDASAEVGTVQKETNPAVQQGKINVAAAEGAARANIEAAAARGSNAALAQVPPHLVAPASAAATKAGEDYAQASSVSDRLQAMMDAAKNGNVVSYQLIPQEGALQITTSQGVHRINMAEIQNYGGGSIFQRIEGKLGGALTGAKIPDSVLKDMQEMQDVQKKGAAEKYNNTLKTINDTYGAKFNPVKMENTTSQGAPKSSATPPGATHTAMGSDGKRHYTNAQGQDLGVAP